MKAAGRGKVVFISSIAGTRSAPPRLRPAPRCWACSAPGPLLRWPDALLRYCPRLVSRYSSPCALPRQPAVTLLSAHVPMLPPPRADRHSPAPPPAGAGAQVAYAASKGALLTLSRSLAAAW